MAPLQENEDARHVRYREDYRAKVIDLYDAQIGLGMNPRQSMRGVFYGDSAAGGDAAKSLKIYDRNGASHDRRGWFDGGRGGGAFDSMHHTWIGDKVPAESRALQEGKRALMRNLVPFTNAIRLKEAGAAILVSDGSVYEFAVGLPNEVRIPLPQNETYITMHTHSGDRAFSAKDYVDFFEHLGEFQMHAVTPRFTFSAYKFNDWKELHYSEEQVKEHIKIANTEAIARTAEKGLLNDLPKREMIKLSLLARQYDIAFRFGIRDPGLDL